MNGVCGPAFGLYILRLVVGIFRIRIGRNSVLQSGVILGLVTADGIVLGKCEIEFLFLFVSLYRSSRGVI